MSLTDATLSLRDAAMRLHMQTLCLYDHAVLGAADAFRAALAELDVEAVNKAMGEVESALSRSSPCLLPADDLVDAEPERSRDAVQRSSGREVMPLELNEGLRGGAPARCCDLQRETLAVAECLHSRAESREYFLRGAVIGHTPRKMPPPRIRKSGGLLPQVHPGFSRAPAPRSRASPPSSRRR